MVSRRPLPQVDRDALSQALHDRGLTGLTGRLRTRTSKRMGILRNSPNPAFLLAWWDGVTPEFKNAGTNLVAHAILGHSDFVTFYLGIEPSWYLYTRKSLANAVRSEREIQGFTQAKLAKRAGVTVKDLRTIEQAQSVSLSTVRKVLRAVNIEPTALPDPDTED